VGSANSERADIIGKAGFDDQARTCGSGLAIANNFMIAPSQRTTRVVGKDCTAVTPAPCG
jgi:hypothetical protein